MSDQQKIGFYPGGGVGDAIISLPALYALHELTGAIPDILSQQPPKLLHDIYHASGIPGDIWPHRVSNKNEALLMEYHAILVAQDMVGVEIRSDANITPLMALMPRMQENRKIFGINNQLPLVNNNQIGRLAVFRGLNRYSLPLYSLGLENTDIIPSLHLQPAAIGVLAQHGLQSGRYITVNDGWDVALTAEQNKRPTKAWLREHWQQCVAQLKAAQPDLVIVQLGSEKSGEVIPGVDVNLRGKTTLAEAMIVLKHAKLHVDTEGGLVHIAHAVGTRSVVLFGPTNIKFFGYPENRNLLMACGDCWWLTNDWMLNCVRGLEVPECMESHQPGAVAAVILEELARMQPVQLSAVPAAVQQGKIAVIENAALAEKLSASAEVVHYSMAGQRNVHRAVPGMRYEQYMANIFNLPARAESFDSVYFTVNPDEHAAFQIKEAARILKSGGVMAVENLDAARLAEIAQLTGIAITPGALAAGTIYFRKN